MDIRVTPPPPPPPPPKPKPLEGRLGDPGLAARKPSPTTPLDPSALVSSGLASAWDEELPDFGDLGLDEPMTEGPAAVAPVSADPRAGTHPRVPEAEVAAYALKAEHARGFAEDSGRLLTGTIDKETFLHGETSKAWPLPAGMTLEKAWDQYAGRTGGNRSEAPSELSMADFETFYAEQVLPQLGGAKAKNGAEALIGIQDDAAFIETAFSALLGRSPGPDSEHLKNLKIMIERDHMSPEEARKQVIKAFMGSDEYKAKQAPQDFEDLGYPMTLMVGGQAMPVMKRVQVESYDGKGIPFGEALSQEAGINAMLDHFGPFDGLGAIAAKDKGSAAAQKLGVLAGIVGDNFYFGYSEGRNYPIRDTAHLGKDYPDLNVDLRRPGNENNCIRDKNDLKTYLEARVEQVKKLVSELDPNVDSPRMLQAGEHALTSLQAMLTFANGTMNGEKAVLFERQPDAKAGWFKNHDPAQPLASDEATIPVNKDEPRWMTVSRHWGAQFIDAAAQDPNSYAARQNAYWAP